MPIERVRVDDPFRDSVGQPATGQKETPDVMTLEADEVPLTDPSTQTTVLTSTVAAAAATVDASAVTTIQLPEDHATVTSVTYKPAGTVAAPSGSNARTWNLREAGNGDITAHYTANVSTGGFTSGTPVTFTIQDSTPVEGGLTIESTHAGTSGFADPGGTLSITYQI